jgi:hypothetical protein
MPCPTGRSISGDQGKAIGLGGAVCGKIDRPIAFPLRPGVVGDELGDGRCNLRLNLSAECVAQQADQFQGIRARQSGWEVPSATK